MNTLNLGSEEVPEGKKKSKNRNLKIALGLAAVILVPTIGSTLAGSITIGTANSVEFGQGFTAAAACDQDGITIIPSSVLVSGTFNLESLTVSSINASGCDTKFFTFKILNSSNVLQPIGASNVTYCKVHFITASGASTTDATSACIVSGGGTSGFAVAPAVTLAASNVSKITLESSSS